MTVICLETIFYSMPLQGPPGLYLVGEGREEAEQAETS